MRSMTDWLVLVRGKFLLTKLSFLAAAFISVAPSPPHYVTISPALPTATYPHNSTRFTTRETRSRQRARKIQQSPKKRE